MPKSTKNKVVNERVLKSPIYGFSSRFEVASKEPTCPFGLGVANTPPAPKDIIILSNPEELRGSPSLVGRGIANPMSERTRGFEIPKGDGYPTPRAILILLFSSEPAASDILFIIFDKDRVVTH